MATRSRSAPSGRSKAGRSDGYPSETSRRLCFVGEGLHKCDKVVFLSIAQAEITASRVQVFRGLGSRPARYLLPGRARLASRQSIPGIIEMDDFLKTLKVAIMAIGFYDVRSWTLVHVAQRRDPEATIKFRPLVHEGVALRIGHVAERVRLRLMVIS